MKPTAKRITKLAVLTALSLIVFRVEALFPPLFIPGAKLGLSNIFSLLTLLYYGYLPALAVVIIRTVLGSIFSGGMSALIYSLTAGVVSISVSALLVRFLRRKISVVAVSVAAAVIHNTVQNIVFCLITKTPQMILYLPYLSVMGIVAGITVGVASTLLFNSTAVMFSDGIRYADDDAYGNKNNPSAQSK